MQSTISSSLNREPITKVINNENVKKKSSQ